MIVVDASYALALVMPDESRPAGIEALVADELAVPAIWPLEMAHAVRLGLRSGRLTADSVEALFRRIDELEIDVFVAPHGQAQRYFDAAQDHDLTPFDATYITMALQFSAALATRDRALSIAAGRAGIRTIG